MNDTTRRILVTVAMAVYNNGPYVGEAIDPILGQTLGDFEFVIVNDGSTDESADVIDERASRGSHMARRRCSCTVSLVGK